MKKRIPLFALALLFVITGTAQQSNSKLVLTADSLATGNYKDVFKSFFQLALNRFTGNKKEIQFTSNPFAVMSKMNPSLMIDTNYIKYTHLRNINFSFSANLDSSFRFNGFTSGIKYSIINRRDETVSRSFVKDAIQANQEVTDLNLALDKFISTLSPDTRKSFREQKNKLMKGQLAFSQLDTSVQRIVKEQASQLNSVNLLDHMEHDVKFNIHTFSQHTYDSLKLLLQNKLLWTAGITDTTYKDQFLFSNLTLSSELLKGISNPGKPVGVELDTRAALNFIDDTLKAGRDLKRSVLNVEPGLNLVFKTKGTQFSWAEFKLSGSYIHNFGSLYLNERRDSLTLNGTLRIRVINDIWIPLEIRYDPKTGNVFGLLNIKANFSAMKTLLGKD